VEIFSNKTVNIVIAIVFTVIYGSWVFWIKPTKEKSQEYTGEIIEVYKKAKWMRMTKGITDPAQYRNYRYYWSIRNESGSIHSAEVPWRLWKSGKEGLPVLKTKGQRYPQINTPDATRKRESDQKAREMVFGK